MSVCFLRKFTLKTIRKLTENKLRDLGREKIGEFENLIICGAIVQKPVSLTLPSNSKEILLGLI